MPQRLSLLIRSSHSHVFDIDIKRTSVSALAAISGAAAANEQPSLMHRDCFAAVPNQKVLVHQGKYAKSVYSLYFSGPWKKCLKWPQMGPGGFFPTNPDLADILGVADFVFENLNFLMCFAYQISGCPGSYISKFSDSQTPQAPAPADKLSDPNLTPLPTHPGIKYVARSPCCDVNILSLIHI